jgi:phosphoribosylformimino-5-aminoimidazole carboxamide ribotide isomerase
MLIPAIDLMGGRIVQLVQGERKALEYADFEPWIERFSKYPLVQLVDLDAAIGSGSNRPLLEQFTRRLPCQVGGGIRNLDAAEAVLDLGAQKVIIGSALLKDGKVNTDVARVMAKELGPDRLVFAADSKKGKVTTHGWRRQSPVTPARMMQVLNQWCSGFLYTHVDSEGLMEGIPMDVVDSLRRATSRRLTVAGGINSQEEIDELDRMDVDAVVGMAVYTGRIRV